MTIGERVLSLLSEKGLTQKSLADALKTKPSTINGWREPNRNPSSDLIIPICDFLNVSAYYLLTGKQDSSATLPPEDQAWLDLIHSLPEETQRDFMGAMRLHAGLHQIADAREEMKEAK